MIPHVDRDVGDQLLDGRPVAEKSLFGDIQHGAGNYLPVSLHWDLERGAAPLWHATEGAISVLGNNIRVMVGNRGTNPATNVEVSVWFREWTTAPPPWEPGSLAWKIEGSIAECEAEEAPH